jgi:hypothetical protein
MLRIHGVIDSHRCREILRFGLHLSDDKVHGSPSRNPKALLKIVSPKLPKGAMGERCLKRISLVETQKKAE